jgi:phosphoglycolate phosphatase
VNRLAVFDCDGTLVDSAGPIYAATAATFAEHDLGLPDKATCRKVIGLGLVEAMAAMVPDGDAALHVELAESYKRHFHLARQQGRVEEPLFPGIADLLQALDEDGWLLAVATGKSDRGLKLCLDSHAIHARFVSLQTGDRHPSKPHPSMVEQAIADAGATPESTVVIGDTSYDMGMAVAAGATAIGAGWGYHGAEELIAAGAVAVADHPREVLALVEDRVDG